MKLDLKIPANVLLQIVLPALLVLGVLLFVLVWRDIAGTEQSYKDKSDLIYNSISRHVRENQAVISGLTVLYGSSNTSWRQFSRFSREMLKLYPHVQAIAILDRVNAHEIPGYLENMHSQGTELKSLTYGNAGSALQQYKNAFPSVLFPISRISPDIASVNRLMGYDVYSDKSIGPYIDKAIRTGIPVSSPPVRLIDGDEVYLIFKSLVSHTQEETDSVLYPRPVKLAMVVVKPQNLLDASIIYPGFRVALRFDDPGRSEDIKTKFMEYDRQEKHFVIKTVVFHDVVGLGGHPLYITIEAPLTLSAIRWVNIYVASAVWLLFVFLILVVINDRYKSILQQKEARDALYREKERADVTLYSLADAVITTNMNGVIEYLNPVAEKITQWSLEDACGKDISSVVEFIDEIRNRPYPNPVKECISSGQTMKSQAEVAMRQKSGDYCSVDFSVAPMRNQDLDVVGAVLVFQDVGAERMMSKLLNYQATHDDLTGLYNRREYERRLSEAIAKVNAGERSYVVFYVDLDQFKIVNDTCGHIAGDIVLRQVAELMKTRVREDETLARLGGDEFGVLLESYDYPAARKLAEEMIEVIRKYRFTWDDKIFEIGASIGIVQIEGYMKTLSEVLSNADAACYQAKEKGGNQAHYYHIEDSELQDRKKQMHWVQKISQAFADGRFALYAQKITSLDGLEPSEHCEILMRMLGDDGEIISPTDFIAAAERYRIMTDIDRWVLRNAIIFIHSYYAKREQETGMVAWQFSINLSGQSLGSGRMKKYVADLLSDYPDVTDKLIFEITETAAISNMDHAMDFIETFSKMGVKFSLDDFGSGVSSFSYLKNLRVDYLKIDGAFVKDMASDPVDFAMVRSINHIGHIMNIKTIAEHVETEEVLGNLRDIGVDYVQGAWIHSPEPLEKVC